MLPPQPFTNGNQSGFFKRVNCKPSLLCTKSFLFFIWQAEWNLSDFLSQETSSWLDYNPTFWLKFLQRPLHSKFSSCLVLREDGHSVWESLLLACHQPGKHLVLGTHISDMIQTSVHRSLLQRIITVDSSSHYITSGLPYYFSSFPASIALPICDLLSWEQWSCLTRCSRYVFF